MNELEKINDKLDKMSEMMSEIQVSQARTEVSIVEHIRRTDLLEENMELIKKDMAPVKEHVAKVNLVAKIVAGVLGAAVTIGAALIKAFK